MHRACGASRYVCRIDMIDIFTASEKGNTQEVKERQHAACCMPHAACVGSERARVSRK